MGGAAPGDQSGVSNLEVRRCSGHHGTGRDQFLGLEGWRWDPWWCDPRADDGPRRGRPVHRGIPSMSSLPSLPSSPLIPWGGSGDGRRAVALPVRRLGLVAAAPCALGRAGGRCGGAAWLRRSAAVALFALLLSTVVVGQRREGHVVPLGVADGDEGGRDGREAALVVPQRLPLGVVQPLHTVDGGREGGVRGPDGRPSRGWGDPGLGAGAAVAHGDVVFVSRRVSLSLVF